MSALAAWCSDIHLNFASPGTKRKFLQSLTKTQLSLFITGDISDCARLERNLVEICKACAGTVYCVSGNHDSYHGSWAKTEAIFKSVALEYPNLVYLPDYGPVKLNTNTCVIGPDGWYDCRSNETLALVSPGLNDFDYIQDLAKLSRPNVIARCQAKADLALAKLEQACKLALTNKYENVIILSHPVPFIGMDTQPSNESQFYIWYSAGQLIGNIAGANPTTNFLWLAGHTHTHADLQVLANLRCVSLAADYEHPRIGAVITTNLEIQGTK